MKRLSFLLIACLAVVTALAQTIVADAPSHIAAGQQFKLTYKVNTDDASDFNLGQMPKEIEVLAGPYTSQQSSYRMINGKTTSSASITYSFILLTESKGTYTLPSATVIADGKKIKSNTVTVTVSGSSNQSQAGSGRNRQGTQQARPQRDNSTQISGSDLFIKVTANKRKVHEQEPILLTYKVYTLVNLMQLDGKMPDLKGFHTQDIPLPQQKSFKVETFNGKPYKTVTWSQYVMFPQHSGKLEIPSITYTGIVGMRNPYIDPFEAFLNGSAGYVEVKKEIKAPGITIDVEALPDRPANFSGGVGQFDITASLDKNEVKANDPVTLSVKINGLGNLKLIKEPKVEFPKDFDVYDPKVTDKTRLTASGVEGTVTYDFLAVPRHPGKYEIPEIEFVYFDSESDTYKTVKTESFALNVAKGSGSANVSNFTRQEDLKLLNKDIRYIKTGDTELRSKEDFFFATPNYWIAIAVMALIFITLVIVFRKRAIENADLTRMKGKKANKVATKRLKNAALLMKNGKANEMYDEVLRALWGYVSDKLSMPVTQLSKENISQNLAEHGVNESTIGSFIKALDECEFARYAPGDTKGNMNKTYDAALAAIMDIEDSMKKNKTGKKMMSVVFVIMTMLPMTTMAVTKAEADSAYADQKYGEAITLYEELLKQGVSADLYYNLGNAYFRTENITRAVINYERALLLSPGDGDIRFNLQMARSKTIDKITPESEMFFVTWYNSVANLMSVDGWAYTALFAMAIAIILALLYLFSTSIGIRKIGFYGGVIAIIVFILANVFAYEQEEKLTNRNGAIIISSSVNVKSTPAKNGTDLFVLHEGTKVIVTDNSMTDWKEIVLADGKEGWVETKQIEMI